MYIIEIIVYQNGFKMLKFYKSLLLIAISISSSYSVEEQKLNNTIKFQTTTNNIECNDQQLLQHINYKNCLIKNMDYDTQQCRKEMTDNFIFDDNEFIILSKYLLSTDNNTNKLVINCIKDYIIKPRNVKKSKIHNKKTLTTIYNISKGNFHVQFEHKDINNIELKEELQNVELSDTQKKYISLLYANYLLSYLFIKYNVDSISHLLDLYNKKHNFPAFLNIYKKNTPFNIIVEKIKILCDNDTKKLGILATEITKSTSKYYQIDENNNILYRLVDKKYKKTSPVYILHSFLQNIRSSSNFKKSQKDKQETLDSYRKAFENIAEQYRSDKSSSDQNDFTENKLKEYIDKIKDISLKALKGHDNKLLKNVKNDILIKYIKKYSDALDKCNQQNNKNIPALVKENNINKNNILLKENKCIEEKDIIENKNTQDNMKITIPLGTKENSNISYDEENCEHISIGNKKKENNSNEIKDNKYNTNRNSYKYNNPMLNNIDKSLNIPYQEYSNNQMFFNNSFQFNNNMSSLFGENNLHHNQLYNSFVQGLNNNINSNISNNNFIPYQVQNKIIIQTQNDNIASNIHYNHFNQGLNNNISSNIFNNNFAPYRLQNNRPVSNQSSINYNYFTQESNNNINSIIHNNNFVQYQVPNKIIIPNQDYNTPSDIQCNHFTQDINNNTNSIISNNNFILPQYSQQKTAGKK